jgi:nucleotidyltransferase/DNA polymerase involved in DNA repair
MSLRLAYSLFPDSRFLPAAQESYLQSTGEIAHTLAGLAGRVEAQDLWLQLPYRRAEETAISRTLPAHYYLDLEDLPSRESLSLAVHAGQTIRRQSRLAPAIGIARHKFTAEVAAALARPNHARPITPGEEARFLASRPITFLPLQAETLRRLETLGIRTLGQLAAMPLPELRVRFGPEVAVAHDMASGRSRVEDALPAPRRERAVRAAGRFETPITNRLVLDAALSRLAGSLAERLAAAQAEALRLHVSWEAGEGEREQRALALRQPTADSRRLAGALRELLMPATFPGGVTTLAAAAEFQQRQVQQPSLFDPAPAAEAGLDLDQLIARHGSGLFFRPAPAEPGHVLPERRFRLRER